MNGERRLQGTLVAADDTAATLRLDDETLSERVVPYDQIDRARTVFVWGPAPKPGKQPARKKAASSTSATPQPSMKPDPSTKEES